MDADVAVSAPAFIGPYGIGPVEFRTFERRVQRVVAGSYKKVVYASPEEYEARAKLIGKRRGVRKAHGAGLVRVRRVTMRGYSRAVLAAETLRLADDLALLHRVRPRTFGECMESRLYEVCPFVGCKHHLYLDTEKGDTRIVYNFPELEPGDLPAKCSLAEIDPTRSMTLEKVGQLLNLTGEKTRTIEREALAKLGLRQHEVRALCDALS